MANFGNSLWKTKKPPQRGHLKQLNKDHEENDYVDKTSENGFRPAYYDEENTHD